MKDDNLLFEVLELIRVGAGIALFLFFVWIAIQAMNSGACGYCM